MRNILTIAFLLCMSFSAKADNALLRAMLSCCPEKTCPLLERDSIDSCIIRETERLVEVQVTECSTLQLARLTDTLYCAVSTFAAPEKESRVVVVDDSWNEVSVIPLPVELVLADKSICDSLSARGITNAEASLMLSNSLVSASFDDSMQLVLTLTPLAMTEEDSKRLKDLVLSRRMKFEGKELK